MADGKKGSAASLPDRPQLPGSLVAVLDGEHPDIGWRTPDEDWIAEHREVLQDALATLKSAMAPAPEAFVRERLAVLATYKGSRAGHPAEWKVRAAEYIRLLGNYPADVWQAACDEWALGNRYFPDLSDLNELMLPRLQERRRYIERLEAMLTVKVEHKPLVCEVWRAHEAELRAEVGERDWMAWVSQATPHSDNGETLILAVATQMIGLKIREKFGDVMERVLGRQVKFVLTPWAGAAARDRQVREERSDAA